MQTQRQTSVMPAMTACCWRIVRFPACSFSWRVSISFVVCSTSWRKSLFFIMSNSRVFLLESSIAIYCVL